MDNTNSNLKKKTTIKASMQMVVFGVEVSLQGIYADPITSLSCIANLTESGQKLKEHFATVIPKDWEYVLEKIDLKNISVTVQFSKTDGLLYYSIGTILNIDGKEIEFKILKQHNELLVVMLLKGMVSFANLPLVGEYLTENSGIEDLQIVYYKKSDKALLQNVFTPLLLEKYPAKKSNLQQGVNIFINAKIGSFQQPLSYPLQAIEDKTETKNSNTKPTKLKGSTIVVPPNTAKKEVVSPKKNFLDVKKFELTYKNKKIGVLVSGNISISIFELEVMGLQVAAPLDLFNDFSFDKFSFELEGLSLNIQKPPLTITGAFLRIQRPTGDDYLGLLNIGFKQLQFTAIGAYSKIEEQTSLFVFGFVGVPMGGPPFFFITGLAFGFGLNRDFILPEISQLESFPLVAICAGNQIEDNPPKKSVLEILQSLGNAVPPSVGSYFIVAGIQFETFKILNTLALVVVKFGNELEINLIGISRLRLPSVYVELAFSAQFAPAKGIFMVRGQLTERSYLLFPGIKLRGGFAVGFWFSGPNSGDFVISIGGYHPRYKIPEHFPNNIPRIGLYLKLGDNVSMSGELYFAITPQAIMAGIAVNMLYTSNILYASLDIKLDLIVLWSPFYYEASISVAAYIKFKMDVLVGSIEYDFHLHSGVDIWGPAFSGKAYLDAGIKTFTISFGENAPKNPSKLSWDDFKSSFIAEKPCTISLSGGLIHKIKTQNNKELWIVNPKELVLITDALIPATVAKINHIPQNYDTSIAQPGIVPMGENTFEASHEIEIRCNGNIINNFQYIKITKNLPKAIWGTQEQDRKQVPNPKESLLKEALTGFEIKPVELISGQTKEYDTNKLSYQINEHTKKFEWQVITFENNLTLSEKNTSNNHKKYTETSKKQRDKSVKALLSFLSDNTDTELDLSDIETPIAVYTYTESFGSTSFTLKPK